MILMKVNVTKFNAKHKKVSTFVAEVIEKSADALVLEFDAQTKAYDVDHEDVTMFWEVPAAGFDFSDFYVRVTERK